MAVLGPRAEPEEGASRAAIFAEVAVEKAGPSSYTYSLRESGVVEPGTLTIAPLGQRRLPGIVVRVHQDDPGFPTRDLRPDECWGPVLSPEQVALASWVARRYRTSLWDALGLMLPPGLVRRFSNASARTSGRFQLWLNRLLEEAAPDAQAGSPEGGLEEAHSFPLTIHQQQALKPLVRALDNGEHRVFLLHGVTGSGKTEVYLSAAERVIAQGGQVLVLVSEIALTPEATERFSARFPGRVVVLHSALTSRQRSLAWTRARAGDGCLIVGSRSAVFAPVRRLGLVVVDEEHEWTYKQDAPPRYHARDVAIARAKLAGACVVLSSATPDVGTYHAASRGRFHLLTLPRRFRSFALAAREADAASALPPVEVVDLRRELREGNSSIFSRSLSAALRDTLERGEQAILFLNRRGTATCVTCRDCGHTLSCRRCETPLAHHRGLPSTGETVELEGDVDEWDSARLRKSGEDARHLLVCHRCNRRRPLVARCPKCGGTRIRYLGVGTQRVEQEVRALFSEARVLRWDRDAAAAAGAHDVLWKTFARGEADVLVGTQMVAKALDVQTVTLVGAVLADSALYLPDFRAAERTFQLLTQVAGRAGRGSLSGRAIVQTYNPAHYAIQAAANHDYYGFYNREIAFRRQFGYPPFRRLVRLVVSASTEARCWREAMRVRRTIADRVRSHDLVDLEVLGPSPCFQRRLRGRYRWQILLFGPSFPRVLDEVTLGPGWAVDVDPVSVL